MGEINFHGSINFCKLCDKVFNKLPEEVKEALDNKYIHIFGLVAKNGFYVLEEIRKKNSIIVICEDGLEEKTIAHELAHIYLGHGEKSCIEAEKEKEQLEKQTEELVKSWGFV